MIIRLLLCGLALAGLLTADELNGHQVKLDSSGRIVAWTEPEDAAYEQVIRRAWDFLIHSVPTEKNGLKSYYSYCCLKLETMHGTRWPHNPACFNAGLAEGAVRWFAYSGDRAPVKLVQELLDYQLRHGTTPLGWKWAGVPYASSEDGATEYRGVHEHKYGSPNEEAIGDGYGVIEPDKAGELGLAYLRFYKLIGDTRYRDAALACANAVAGNIRHGDYFKSPWPFRVYAESGQPREEYSSAVIFPIRLFDEMMALKLGDAAVYRKARDMAWAWMMKFPMHDMLWSGYFEDVYQQRLNNNLNQFSPMETARYLMEHPDLDPEWRPHVADLIRFVERHFVVDVPGEPAVQWGANTVSEQLADMNKMGSHTSRYASVLALWSEMTGDVEVREKSRRSFNWATYMCRDNGFVHVGPVDQSLWFSDGYADYIKHFLAGMAAVPAWAPDGGDHILSSSSIVRDVQYEKGSIRYRTFDAGSTEEVKLSFKPASISNGNTMLSLRSDLGSDGYTLQAAGKSSYVVRVRHSSPEAVVILAQR
jgi:hypothetical protein